MFKVFKPRMYYQDIFKIDYNKLQAMGIKVLLFDLDNTIEPIFINLPDDKDIKLLEAHTIWDKVELKILDFFPNSNIFIHLDPFDDSSKDFCKLW